MQKRNLFILSVLGIFLISCINVQAFSVGDFLDEIETSTLVLPMLFIIFFAFINFTLLKFFKGNTTFAGITSFAISTLLVYGINYLDLEFENIFYNIGVPSDLVAIIVPLLLLVASIFLISKIKLGWFLIVLGLLFLLASRTEIVYETEVLGFLGAILLIIGGIIKFREKGRNKYDKTKGFVGKGMKYAGRKAMGAGRYVGKKARKAGGRAYTEGWRVGGNKYAKYKDRYQQRKEEKAGREEQEFRGQQRREEEYREEKEFRNKQKREEEKYEEKYEEKNKLPQYTDADFKKQFKEQLIKRIGMRESQEDRIYNEYKNIYKKGMKELSKAKDINDVNKIKRRYGSVLHPDKISQKGYSEELVRKITELCKAFFSACD